MHLTLSNTCNTMLIYKQFLQNFDDATHNWVALWFVTKPNCMSHHVTWIHRCLKNLRLWCRKSCNLSRQLTWLSPGWTERCFSTRLWSCIPLSPDAKLLFAEWLISIIDETGLLICETVSFILRLSSPVKFIKGTLFLTWFLRIRQFVKTNSLLIIFL